MTSESDLKVLVTPSPEQSASNRNSQSEKDGDTDSGSVNQPLDPLRKRWMVAAALTDTPELASMLKEDAKLADFKVLSCILYDFNSLALIISLFFCALDIT